MKKTTLLLLLLSISICTATSGQSVLKIVGGHLKINGTAQLILHNAQFNNAGSFDPGTSTVVVCGDLTDAESAIGGSVSTTFYNLEIDKSSNGSQLQQAIQVDNELRMTSGNLDLNGHDLTLGTANGTIANESPTSRITGPAGGEIIKTLDLNAPNGGNPGNIGAVFTTADNLGMTTVKRGHVPESIAGTAGIERYYEITPTNNTNLNATVQFQYFDAELNGITEPELGPWRKDDAFWFNAVTSDSNMVTNFVEASNINLFSRWTLAAEAPKLSLKVMLQGAYSANNDMRDDLRAQDLLQPGEPYAALGYNHVSSGGGESIANSILETTTADAPVDWVFVELRAANNSATVIAARSALLQKDGDIVDLDGLSPLSFPGIAKGNSLFHRRAAPQSPGHDDGQCRSYELDFNAI